MGTKALSVTYPDGYPVFARVELPDGDSERLKAMQELVGGLIECVGMPTYDLWLNEEGLIDLPWHRLPNSVVPTWTGGVAGDFFFTGPPDDEGNVTSISDMTAATLIEAITKGTK